MQLLVRHAGVSVSAEEKQSSLFLESGFVVKVWEDKLPAKLFSLRTNQCVRRTPHMEISLNQ